MIDNIISYQKKMKWSRMCYIYGTKMEHLCSSIDKLFNTLFDTAKKTLCLTDGRSATYCNLIQGRREHLSLKPTTTTLKLNNVTTVNNWDFMLKLF